jgi:hypothetical protein
MIGLLVLEGTRCQSAVGQLAARTAMGRAEEPCWESRELAIWYVIHDMEHQNRKGVKGEVSLWGLMWPGADLMAAGWRRRYAGDDEGHLHPVLGVPLILVPWIRVVDS